MAFTVNEIALLLAALFIGLVLGLMFSGRGKYKRLWREEQLVHRRALRDHDARIAAEDRHIDDAQRRSRRAPATGSAMAADAAEQDDLTRIHAISTLDQRTLNEAGYHRYDQIAAMNDEQQATLEARLGRPPGIIAHEQWREQARELAAATQDRREAMHPHKF